MYDDDSHMGKTPKYEDHARGGPIRPNDSSRLGYSLRSSKMVQLKDGAKNYKSDKHKMQMNHLKGHSNSISLNNQHREAQTEDTNRAKTANDTSGGATGKRMSKATYNNFPARKIKI